MLRKHIHIRKNEKEILELKEQGLTHSEIGERFRLNLSEQEEILNCRPLKRMNKKHHSIA